MILPDSAVLPGWDLHCWMSQWLVHWGALLGFQGAEPLFRPIVVAQTVSSLPVEHHDAVHSLKKPHETGQVYQATGSQGLIHCKNSIFVMNKWTLKRCLQRIFQYQVNALSVTKVN